MHDEQIATQIPCPLAAWWEEVEKIRSSIRPWKRRRWGKGAWVLGFFYF